MPTRHLVRTADQASFVVPEAYKGLSSGFRRWSVVNGESGSVHQEFNLCELDPGGSIDPHLHTFEESLYILEGQLICETGDGAFAMEAGDYGLIQVGAPHALRNTGGRRVRWAELLAPQPRLDGDGDVFRVPPPATNGAPRPVDPRDPRTRFFGRITPEHMDPTKQAQSLLAVSASMRTALLVYSGRHGKVGECGKAGVYGPDTTFIHCTTLSDDEIQMIVDTGGTVSLSVPVEMQMGHGMPPTQRFLDRGLRPSLSVDVETNVPSDFFTQMRSTISLQRVMLFDRVLRGEQNLPPFLTARDVLEFATIEGARANGLSHKVGTLTPGKEADVILLRTDLVNVFPVNDPIGAVVWGMDTSNVDSVFVAGKALKRNGQLLGVDMNRIRTMTYASRDYVVAASDFKLPSL